MIRLSSLALAFLVPTASLLLSTGCAGAGGDAVGEATDELSSAGRSLVGQYSTPHPTYSGLMQLVLRNNGTYTAKYDLPNALCANGCEEAGRFTASRANQRTTLKLMPRGEQTKTYVVSKGTRVLTLTRNGQSEYLAAFARGECNANVDCNGNERCAPTACLVVGEPNDPTGCPSVCQPPHVPEPSPGGDPNGPGSDPSDPDAACWGAWLDQFNTCRTPADGVYPASCCANL